MQKKPNTFRTAFEENVIKYKDKIAVIDPDTGVSLTYEQLDIESRRIAAKLKEAGVKKGDAVAIVLPHSLEFIMSMLAVAKLGAAFAPLNAAYPKDRLQYIYNDCKAKVIITPDYLKDVSEYTPISENTPIEPSDPAVLVYTSGSTGNPKGVLLDHDAIFDNAVRNLDFGNFKETEVVGLGAPFFFIAGATFIFGGLVFGATHVLISMAAMRDPVRLATLLAEQKVTYTFISPKMLKYFKTAPGSVLRLVMAGSERLSGFYSDEFEIINCYGMTETCGGCLSFYLDKAYDNTPVGKPLGDMRAYVLDENGNEVEEGELCLTGKVATCYINRPEETAKTFVENPFIEKDGNPRMLKTGDLVRRLPDGNILYVNRKDWMIKINGQRVEPGEIEIKVREIEGVKDAAVKDFTDNTGQTFIVAYYVADSQMDDEVIRKELSNKLPDYMVPSFYVWLERLPINANGKLDRNALKNPDTSAKKASYVAPENELQEKIVKAYEKVLLLSKIGIDDDFFSLGGDSIRVVMLQKALKDEGITVAASDIFATHTPRALSAVTGQQSKLAAYKGHDADSYPLTHAQMSIYMDCQMPGKDTAYNNTIGLFLPNEKDGTRLLNAADKVLNSYPVFMSAARLVNGVPSLVLLKGEKIQVKQVSSDETDRNKLVESVNTPFSLEDGPLCRGAVFTTPEGLFLVCVAHHIVSDGTSMSILANNIAAAYNGKELESEDMSNFTLSLYEAEHKEEMKADEDIYRKMLETLDGNTSLFEDEGIICEENTNSLGVYHTTVFSHKSELSGVLTDSLTKNGVTESSLFMTAYAYTLGLLCGQKDVVFFAGENGRHDPVLMNTVGMLVHNIPVCVHLDEKKIGMVLAKEIQELFHELVSHDNVDYASLLSEYSVSSDNFFVYQGEMFAGVSMDGKNIPMELFAPKDAMNPLTLHVIKQADGDYFLAFDYDARKYKEDTIKRMASLFIQVVEGLCKEEKLSDIRLTTDDNILEMDNLNDTKKDYPVTDIISMYREAVENYPDNKAVVFGDKILTYRQLDEITERLAGYLCSKGIGRGKVVSILIPRCEYMPITAIGVLKTGAAYQPLDSTYPTDRLTLMMEDANCDLLIAEESLLEKVPNYKGDILLIKDIETLPACDRIKPNPSPEDLFILLYTSGSTGVPKGVMLEHRNLANFVCWYQDYYGFDATCRMAAYASFGFDACMMDMYVPLTVGGMLMIVEEDVRLDLKAIEKLFIKWEITHAFMTTQVGRQFYSTAKVPSLRYLSTGGEKLAALTLRPEVNTKLCNVYGPTECSIFTTLEPIEKNYERIPIGGPISNYKCYVVDENMRRLPPMVPGELLIAGRGVSRGYLNREDLTDKAFVPNPFSNEKNYLRVYHTGDVVRLLPDGSYDFVGRNDSQVKIRGFRIELSEIEAVIREYPDIKDVTVQAFDNEGGSGKFIAAYIVSDKEIDITSLHEFIGQQKPYYMIPAVTMQIDSIPLNQNQKVNKKELPKPVRKAVEIVPPASDMEQSLYDICSEIVNYEEFGVTAPLEEIGFTSLSYIELASKVIDVLGVELKLSDLMAGGTTIRSLAELVSKTETVSKKKTAHKERYPLAPQQYSLTVPSPTADMYREFIFTDQWQDAVAIRRTFVNIINSFPYLYTTFRFEDGQWYQIPYKGELITESDIQIIEKEPTEKEIDDFCYSYDIKTADRLFDMNVYKGEKIVVLLHVHHILMDHVFVEKFVSYISKALRDPDFAPAEQSDYFEYAEENAVTPKPVEGKELHRVEKTELVQGGVDIKKMKPVMDKYKLQPAEYLFAVLSQAYLDVMGLDVAVIRNIFGGRNDARYFDTAGYFPMAIPVPVKKDSDILSHVKHDIVSSIARSQPKDDYGYNALVNHDYEWPYITFNCMEYISQTKDFELISLLDKNPVASEEIKTLTNHINFLCFVVPEKGAVINLNYDPSTIDAKKAQSILDRVIEIANYWN